MTAVSDTPAERFTLPELPEVVSNAQACTRTRTREETPPPVVAVSDAPARPRAQWLTLWLVRVAAGGPDLHTRPASLAEAHKRHTYAAGHFGAPLFRWLRMGWAYLVHMPFKTTAHCLDWVLESPARAIVAAALLAAAWHWH